MARARSVIDTILAEAGGKTRAERYEDMKAIVSVMVNRAEKLGVPLEDVVQVQTEFNGYNRPLPAGVERYRALAEKALQEVQETGPIHSATFYATPKAAGNLPDGLQAETETAGHRYFSDPHNRAIRTAQGYIEPAGESILASYAPSRRLAAEPSAFDSLFGGYSAAPQQRFERNGRVSPENAGLPSEGLLSSPREGYGSPFGALGDRITSGFGMRTGPQTPFGVGSSNHKGVDLSLEAGVSGYPAEAAAGGVVSFAGPAKGYGNMVEISHPDGMRTRYGHLSEIGNLAIGDEIARGTPIGTVGNTGRSRGPHLHFETIGIDGNPVDPSEVVGFDGRNRVPTPEERPQAWQDASPMAVERRELPSIESGLLSQQKQEYGLLADTMRQTPSLNLSGAGVDLGAAGRMMDNADVAQGSSALRDAMLGATPVGRASPAEMASMQAEANRARQEMEMRMGSTFSLSPDQQQAALARRENAMGILSAQTQPQGSFASITQPDTMGAQPITAEFNPSSYPSNIQAAERLTGIAPTMTNTTPVSGLLSDLPDISAPIGMNEYTGFTANPATISAMKTGVQPIGVKSVDPGLLNAEITGPVTIEGPVTSNIAEPATRNAAARSTRKASTPIGGLLSSAEYDAVRAQQEALSKQGKNKGEALKKGLGTIGGGILGAMLAGPLGGILGGYFGPSIFNGSIFGQLGTGVNHFPAAPREVSRGDGRLTESGRDAYRDSGQFRDAYDRGDVGLW